MSNARQQLWAFDRLPPRLRRALDAAPFKFSAVAVFDHFQHNGEAATIALLRQLTSQYLAAAEQEREQWQTSLKP